MPSWSGRTPEPREVDLDAGLEQQQDHAQLGQQLELGVVDRQRPGQRRHRQAGTQEAGQRGQRQPAGHPAQTGSQQHHRAQLQDQPRCVDGAGGGQHRNHGSGQRPRPRDELGSVDDRHSRTPASAGAAERRPN
jgi:hypothetical protein